MICDILCLARKMHKGNEPLRHTAPALFVPLATAGT